MESQKYLNKIYNPSLHVMFYPRFDDGSEQKKQKLISKQEIDKKTYSEIVQGLENDLINSGMNLTYASRILINQIASNLLILFQLKTEFITKGILQPKKIWKKDKEITKKKNFSKNTKDFCYEEYWGEDKVHPAYEKLIPKIQKKINEDLKALGLLPTQQIERRKLTIIQKLKQEHKDFLQKNQEYSVEAKRTIEKG